MIVFWTPEAVRDRLEIWNFIAADNPHAAVRMDAIFSNAASLLEENPRLGRTGRIPGTLEMIPHESYALIYEIEGDSVWILALTHTARQWPPVSP